MTGKQIIVTTYNKTYGTFAENGNEAFMVLNRIFEPKDGDFTSTEIDNTSYIDPSKYNYIFAETSAESQNFWVQIGFGIEARRVMCPGRTRGIRRSPLGG